MIRRLPMRFASKACPSSLLILLARRCGEILSLEIDLAPPTISSGSLRNRRVVGHVVLRQSVDLPENRIFARGGVRFFEFAQGWHQVSGA